MEFPSVSLVFRKIIRPTATQPVRGSKNERGSRVKITFSCLRVIHIFINNRKSVASFFTALLNVFIVRGTPLFGDGIENSKLEPFFPWKLNIYE